MSENTYLMQFYDINFSQIMIFRLYNVHNKFDDDKIGDQTNEKSQILLQVLELFFCQLYT